MNCNLKEKLSKNEFSLGTWVTIPSTDVPDMLQCVGFEWLVFDTEHAPLTQQTVSSMIQAIDTEKVCPIVRVGEVNQYLAKSYLDMGAHGIVFPLVNSREDARRAVSFCKYPPEGIRGTAPRKAAKYGLEFSSYIRNANSLTTVIVQIETKEALRNIEEIVSTEGVDVAFVGPTDLTMSLGLLDDRKNVEVSKAMKVVVAACEKYNKVAGVLAADKQEINRAVELGFKFIAVASDTRFLMSSALENINYAREKIRSSYQ